MSRTVRSTQRGIKLNDTKANQKWACRCECLHCESDRIFNSNKNKKIALQKLKDEKVK